MQINNIKRKTVNKKSRSVGRGGKRGKTSGRGTKGQKARAGGKLRPEVRDFIKRLPKLKGRGKNSNLSIYGRALVVNVGALEVAFSSGDTINPQTLAEKKLISVRKSVRPEVKILSGGEITKKIVVTGCSVSKSAREKIEKAGGTVA